MTPSLSSTRDRVLTGMEQGVASSSDAACTLACTSPVSELTDARLRMLIDAWPLVPEPMRAGIMAMIREFKSAQTTLGAGPH